MPQGDGWFDFTDLRGGRNGGDPPEAIDPTQVNEALNVDYEDGQIARKRGGAEQLSLTFSSGGPFVGSIYLLFNHLASTVNDLTSLELWGMDASGLIGQLAASVQWVGRTAKDVLTGLASDALAATFNGKALFLYKSAANRIQCWDGTSMRRLGIICPSASPTASTSAGAITDTRRYWATVIVKSGTTILRRSELNQTPLSQALTAQRATVSLGGAPGEGETHWELWAASLNADNYASLHYVGEVAIGNTIVDNSTRLLGVAPPLTGTNLVMHAAEFALSDGDRWLFAGAYNPTANTYGIVPSKVNRVWWTPRLGDRDIGDDERVVITVGTVATPAVRSYIDVDEGVTGLGGPVAGSNYVFSARRVWRFSPTGNYVAPYRRVPMGVPYGCIHARSIALGQDEGGYPALYFASDKGICRIQETGVVFCGWDVSDIWGTVNLSATIPVTCLYVPPLQQLWVHVATGANTEPNERLVFHTRYGVPHETKGIVHGWTRQTGVSCAGLTPTMFATTPGTSMSRKQSPYIAPAGIGAVIVRGDTAGLQDTGSDFQAYVEKVLVPPYPADFRLGNAYLLAKALSGLSLRHSITADFGKQQARIADFTLTPVGTETRIWKQIEDSALAGIQQSATVRLGDAAAQQGQWVLDRWKLAADEEQPQ